MRFESDANLQGNNNNSDCVSLQRKDVEAGGRWAVGSSDDFKYWSDIGKHICRRNFEVVMNIEIQLTA